LGPANASLNARPRIYKGSTPGWLEATQERLAAFTLFGRPSKISLAFNESWLVLVLLHDGTHGPFLMSLSCPERGAQGVFVSHPSYRHQRNCRPIMTQETTRSPTRRKPPPGGVRKRGGEWVGCWLSGLSVLPSLSLMMVCRPYQKGVRAEPYRVWCLAD